MAAQIFCPPMDRWNPCQRNHRWQNLNKYRAGCPGKEPLPCRRLPRSQLTCRHWRGNSDRGPSTIKYRIFRENILLCKAHIIGDRSINISSYSGARRRIDTGKIISHCLVVQYRTIDSRKPCKAGLRCNPVSSVIEITDRYPIPAPGSQYHYVTVGVGNSFARQPRTICFSLCRHRANQGSQRHHHYKSIFHISSVFSRKIKQQLDLVVLSPLKGRNSLHQAELWCNR